MEIINNDSDSGKDPRPKKDVVTGRNAYLGIILIAIGGVWLLSNFGMLSNRIFNFIFSWQALLMALGGYFLVVRKWVPGIVLLSVGVVFALSDWYHLYVPMSKVILPVILIGAGLAVALQRK